MIHDTGDTRATKAPAHWSFPIWRERTTATLSRVFHAKHCSHHMMYAVFNPHPLRCRTVSPNLQVRTGVSKEVTHSRSHWYHLTELDLKPDRLCSQWLSLAVASQRNLPQIAESRLRPGPPNFCFPLQSLISHCSYHERQGDLLCPPVAPCACLCN